mgnify:CR=1 FL=1
MNAIRSILVLISVLIAMRLYAGKQLATENNGKRKEELDESENVFARERKYRMSRSC